MSNNKQSSVDLFYQAIKMHLTPNQIMHLEQIYPEAKAMHKEEIRKAYCYGEHYKDTKLTTDYYNETFGGKNEQQ